MNAHGRKKVADEKRLLEAGRKAVGMMKDAEQVAALANARATEAVERIAQLDRDAAEARRQCHAALEAAKASEETATAATARANVLDGVVTEVMRILGLEGLKVHELIPAVTDLVAERTQLRQEGAELAAQCVILDRELKEEKERDVSFRANDKLKRQVAKLAEERDAALRQLDQAVNPRKSPTRLTGVAALAQALAASDAKDGK